ncbi:hypothetical protein QYF36_004017 [Acer negundo]|nr:hypothetical protein QYF36_004017 [Acer negundo]
MRLLWWYIYLVEYLESDIYETRNGSGKYLIEKESIESHFLVNIVRIRHITLWNVLHILPDSSDIKQRENRKVDLNDMLACFHVAHGSLEEKMVEFGMDEVVTLSFTHQIQQ